MSSIYRIIFIHDEITRFGKVTTEKIRNEFEITTRQVQRDVQEMKRMGAPMEYSPEKGGYIYKKPWYMFDYADKKTLLFYLFAKKMAGNLALVPVVANKLLSEIEDIYLKNYGDLAKRISYEFSDTEPFQPEIIGKILESMHTHTAIDIEYSNALGVNSKRTVEPWHLLNYSGKWYILAWCRESKELRTFHVSRIMKMLGQNAEPEPFAREIDETMLKKCLNDGYGIFKCDNTVKVTVRFHGPVINFVKNRSWHPAQKLVERIVDGRKCIDLTLPVGDYTEITGIILSYSPNAEALSPSDFRDKWLQRVKETAERFITD
ncbi:MAG TPA: WYL domain-containing protein [bacterium]|nr:WYL domain-containing protein [bacterium]